MSRDAALHALLGDPAHPPCLDAPAVIAIAESFSYRRTWVPVGDGYWASVEDGRAHWRDLRDVTPLYPKEDEEPPKPDTLHDAPRWRHSRIRYDGPWGTRLGGDPA